MTTTVSRQDAQPVSVLVTVPGRGATGADPADPAVLVAEREPPRAPAALHQVIEDRCDDLRSAGADLLAVDGDDVALTFEELDRCANQLAHHLLGRGVRPGDRVALLLDRPVDSYVAVLAASKARAAFVPLDVGFPDDRIAYILDDADVGLVLARASTADRVDGRGRPVLRVDDASDDIAAEDPRRPVATADRTDVGDDLAYIIYTSGSTGRPKGVAVAQRSIAAFVTTAAEVYGLHPDDRVYQGMTTAFDFSVEEIWVPLAAGATVVPKPAGETLLGADLAAYLHGHGITALCCVPTLLATLDDDLPQLRFLLVSGEACPQDLVARWHQPERRFLNVYGPTEATVTATWTALHPERPVTIGVPLPGYAVVLLDAEDPTRALPAGEVGEIALAGVGLAQGYVNRDDKTREVFVPDTVGVDRFVDNPSGRLYRTGDLGRITDDGEISYQGRIDLQVKIRGYRIELTEIESVLLGVEGVAAAVVDVHEPTPGAPELVGYYTVRADADPTDATILEHLRAELPAYMVPAYLERLDAIPLTTNDKADRAGLPAPRGGRAGGGGGEHVEPATDSERLLADALAGALHADAVSVTADLFDDLAVTSLLVATFTARLRDAGRSLSVREVYRDRTVRAMAATVDAAGDGTDTAVAEDAADVVRTRTVPYVLTGVAQLLTLLVGAVALGLGAGVGYDWIAAGPSWGSVIGRGAVVTAIAFGVLCVLPVVAKWVLVGRWTPREIRLWSPGYFRFWLVKTLVRVNPLRFLVGTPVYTLYLRALGARVGRGALILSGFVPVATDLIAIGDGAVVRRDARFSGYRALPGRLELGPVAVGADALVGERGVLDVGTSVGDGATLGHSSALHPGAAVPAGETWHGSPAEPTTTDYRTVPAGRSGAVRRAVFGTLVLVGAVALAGVLLTAVAWTTARVAEWADTTGIGTAVWVAAVALPAVAAALLVLRLLVMVVVPRLLAPLVRPGRLYPLYGVAHLAQLAVFVVTNARFLVLLVGDSSAVTGFLRGLGYRLTPLEQTGSNFGTQIVHDAPRSTRVGTGTMVSDGLRVVNADWSAAAFRVSPVTVGERTFLGNDVIYPAGARIGDNCLLGTKVLVPVDGPVRHDVGLVGSPSFEIPRSRPPEDPRPDEPPPRSLRAKNAHNVLSMLLLLLGRAAQLAAGLALSTLVDRLVGGLWALPAAAVALAVVVLGSEVLLERAALGFRRQRPHDGSIYDPVFWRHERLWKFYRTPVLAGTPFQNLLRRLAGARGGRRAFDDGAVLPEKTLVSLGDDVVLNEGSVIQCHSLEDGRFSRDDVAIGDGVTLGVGAFVHYGTTVGDGAVVGADAFLMKGEQVPAGASWAGNPAAPA